MTRLLTWLIRGYQLIVSPWIAPRCRYTPTCSSYAIEALRVHGPARGTWLAVTRVLRCNPWSAGGPDPVPPRRTAPPHPAGSHEDIRAPLTSAGDASGTDRSTRPGA